MPNNLLAWLGIGLMRLLAFLPLRALRALGAGLGYLFYALARRRRQVVKVNLRLCFPEWDAPTLRQCAREVFVFFMQAWLDRAWLWHGSQRVLNKRLHLSGAGLPLLRSGKRCVLFVPHFVGLDAGGAALTLKTQREFISIYTPQKNAVVDRWLWQGRQRWGNTQLFQRKEGVRPLLSAIAKGKVLYLLPDMSFGVKGAVFVPFFGVPAATVPSLSRFASLAKASVLPVVARLTKQGYNVEVGEAWPNFPTPDLAQDTLRMNQMLEGYIKTMPAQYYWVHRRFKDRPPGAAAVYP
jgi:KDO2-lipid IV(A) lauroyltransferase